MMWRGRRQADLEDRLRALRQEPRKQFVEDIVARVSAPRPTRPWLRLGVAVAAAVLVAVPFLAFGGVGFAAHSVQATVHSITGSHSFKGGDGSSKGGGDSHRGWGMAPRRTMSTAHRRRGITAASLRPVTTANSSRTASASLRPVTTANSSRTASASLRPVTTANSSRTASASLRPVTTANSSRTASASLRPVTTANSSWTASASRRPRLRLRTVTRASISWTASARTSTARANRLAQPVQGVVAGALGGVVRQR